MNRAQLIQSVGKAPVIGSALRRYASRYKDGSVVTIKSGVARGLRWRRYHRYVNGYWTGQYEYPMQQALSRLLGPGKTFWDVGANAGFFSLVARKLVGESGRVVSFDPDPENAASVREQISINDFGSNWSCESVAVGDAEGELEFRRSAPGSPKGHLTSTGVEGFNVGEATGDEVMRVPVVTYDSVLGRLPGPDVIKMEIEGAELLAMAGASRLLADVRPTWLIELHGPACERVVRTTLSDAGYSFRTVEGEAVPSSSDSLPRHFVAVTTGAG
ncbi:MAG: FkbM family methyltransferase [Planctomycetota bacterium]